MKRPPWGKSQRPFRETDNPPKGDSQDSCLAGGRQVSWNFVTMPQEKEAYVAMKELAMSMVKPLIESGMDFRERYLNPAQRAEWDRIVQAINALVADKTAYHYAQEELQQAINTNSVEQTIEAGLHCNAVLQGRIETILRLHKDFDHLMAEVKAGRTGNRHAD